MTVGDRLCAVVDSFTRESGLPRAVVQQLAKRMLEALEADVSDFAKALDVDPDLGCAARTLAVRIGFATMKV